MPWSRGRRPVKTVVQMGGPSVGRSVAALLAPPHGNALRGAVVIIASDGWDSDPPDVLTHALERVRRRAERVTVPGFMADYEDLVVRYGPERPRVKTHELAHFFEDTAWRLEKLPNQQRLDFEGLRGRFLSSSYTPLPGTSSYASLAKGLSRLFEEHQQDGHVTLVYETEVYFGLSEFGIVARQPEMACHGQFTASSQGKTVNGCDHRHRHPFDHHKDPLPPF